PPPPGGGRPASGACGAARRGRALHFAAAGGHPRVPDGAVGGGVPRPGRARHRADRVAPPVTSPAPPAEPAPRPGQPVGAGQRTSRRRASATVNTDPVITTPTPPSVASGS